MYALMSHTPSLLIANMASVSARLGELITLQVGDSPLPFGGITCIIT